MFEEVEEYLPADLYAAESNRIESPGGATYYVSPNTGDDAASGASDAEAWQSFAAVNRMRLRAGDRVIVSPGDHHVTLKPDAIGTQGAPVNIDFKKGVHAFYADKAARLRYYISNAADNPKLPRPIGILLQGCQHLKISGEEGSDLIFHDRMIYFVNDGCENVSYQSVTFDMHRPTVSELLAVAVTPTAAVFKAASGSEFKIENGKFEWIGDLGEGWTMVQEAVPGDGRCWRLGQWNPFKNTVATSEGAGTFRLEYRGEGTPRPTQGHQYQFRRIVRDNVTACNVRCRNVKFNNVRFYAMPGMGVVSQFTENISFIKTHVEPRAAYGRTCPAWADCFHFSGCRGHVMIEGCRFSGTQDDPINVHGTHLRLSAGTGPRSVRVQYMHGQTYGFEPFQKGDRVAFVSHRLLRPYFEAVVLRSQGVNEKEWLLELDRPHAVFEAGDVVDNLTWYPELMVKHCSITMDSCRGILTTTRGKTVIENVEFQNTTMTAIEVADDANSWFESGAVRDLTIRDCTFRHTGDPAINIHPETESRDPALPVHSGIKIENCRFESPGGIYARCVQGLTITGNHFAGGGQPIHTEACTEVKLLNNKTGQ